MRYRPTGSGVCVQSLRPTTLIPEAYTYVCQTRSGAKIQLCSDRSKSELIVGGCLDTGAWSMFGTGAHEVAACLLYHRPISLSTGTCKNNVPYVRRLFCLRGDHVLNVDKGVWSSELLHHLFITILLMYAGASGIMLKDGNQSSYVFTLIEPSTFKSSTL